MKKQFIICHGPGSKAQDQVFLNWIKSNGLGWWHWFDGSWLVIDSQGSVTVEQIRDAVQAAYPTSYCMIFEHGTNRYAGIGPNDEAQRARMAGWLETNWKP